MGGDRILRAIGLRLLSVALFALMNVGIKLAEARGAALGEILFWRQAGAGLFVGAVVLAGPGVSVLATRRLPAHVVRMGVGLSAMALTFYTLTLLPLAEATTLGFSMPIFATILGAAVLKEPTGWHRWAAVAMGFAGVLIVTRPGMSGPGGSAIPPLGAAAGIAAAFGTALVSILLRRIGRTERPLATVFWFSFLSLGPLGIVYVWTAQGHAAIVWLLLIGLGLLGGMAQIAMTASLSHAPVSVVVPMDYTMLLWATLFGWQVFDRLPAAATWAGAPVIVASGLYIVWREHVRRREETSRAVAEN